MAVTVNKIRVAILEDHQATMDGYKYRLNQDAGIKVVGTALYGDEIEPLLDENPVDVLILDIGVKMTSDNLNPFYAHYAIAKYTQKYHDLKVLVISMHDTRRLIESVMKSGASGYILKDDSKAMKELGSIIRLISSGGKYFSEKAYILLSEEEETNVALSPRQIEALSLCAAYPDATLKELAAKMTVADPTVRNLLSKAYERLGVRTRGAAVARAKYLGLIP